MRRAERAGPRGPYRRGPPTSDAAPAEPLAKRVEAERKAVEDAATVSGALWLSYVLVLLYLAIAAGSVTHLDLLLERSVKLPFLNIDLPLVPFFALAPLLFIAVHVYTLVHFVMLSTKVRRLDAELVAAGGPDDPAAERIRHALPSSIVVQALAGARESRDGGLGRLLRRIAWSTLVLAPVLLLLLLQAQFLPYHLEWVTWLHRIAVAGDLWMLWMLWPAVMTGDGNLRPWRRFGAVWRVYMRPWRRAGAWWRLYRQEWWRVGAERLLSSRLRRRARAWRHVYESKAFEPRQKVFAPIARFLWLSITTLTPVAFALTIATFPGEWLDEHVGRKKWIAANPVTAWLGQTDRSGEAVDTSIHDLLFNGRINDVSRRRASVFSNTLVVSGQSVLDAMNIDDEKKLAWPKFTLPLRGRQLRGAVFDGADLRKADLTGAQLQGASLQYAQLQGASLFRAQLQGASLAGAQLQGASLDGAQLQGASLGGAQLQGASLGGAQLQGASLGGAQLQGASLDGAQLQGASLDGAQLQGASLDGAQLQGASLDGAQLQGASLGYMAADATSFDIVHLWRTSSRRAKFQHIVANRVIWTAEVPRFDGSKPWSHGDFTTLRDFITKEVPQGSLRDNALNRLSVLDPDVSDWTYDLAELHLRNAIASATVAPGDYRTALARSLRSLMCDSDLDERATDKVFVVQGLLRNRRLWALAASAPAWVEDVIKSCAIAGLTDADKAALRAAAKQAAASD